MYGLTILMLRYMYTEMEQLSKWMVNDVAQFLTVKVGVYGQAKGRDQNDQCGNRLDTETSVRTQL